MSMKNINRTIEKYGEYRCVEAYRLNVHQGEGGSMIANELDVHVNATSAMIAAGEVLLAWKGVRAVDVMGAGLGLLKACGPCNFARIQGEIETQVIGVSVDNANLLTHWFLDEAKRRKLISNDEDEDGKYWDVVEYGEVAVDNPFKAWETVTYVIATRTATYTYEGMHHGFGVYAALLGFPPRETVQPGSVRTELVGKSRLEGLAGPMWDGGKVRYEDSAVCERLGVA